MRYKFSKCFSVLFAGVFIFNVVMPYGWVSADELTDTPNIGVENEVVLAPSSTAQVRSNGTYTSTVDSVPDRWTVGDVIQYSCDAPAGADVTWSVTVSGVISVTDTGLVTALGQGYTMLKAEWANNSMSTQVYVGTIPDGTYFIGNKQTGKYMKPETTSTADGVNIEQWAFDGGIQSQWSITLDQYGYYLIESVCTGKYVGVENSSSSTNAKIKQYSFHRTSPGIRWLITPTASGAYKFTCQAAEGTNMVITVPSSGSTANGTDLIQYPYANNAVYRDEWEIFAKTLQIEGVPTHLTSNSMHYCIPCAITNITGYWSNNGYPIFNCGSNSAQERFARNVQTYMGEHYLENNYIWKGFEYFATEDDQGNVYWLNSSNYWINQNVQQFTMFDIFREINAGRPLMLGYTGIEGGSYSEAHMTVCVGYEIDGDIVNVYVSDAHRNEYKKNLLQLGTDNDFISKVTPYIQSMN